MLLWIAAAGAQWVWIGLKSSVVSHTAPLSKVIAAATSVFALRDVFVTIFITAPSMPLLYWTTLLRSVTDGVFVVRIHALYQGAASFQTWVLQRRVL